MSTINNFIVDYNKSPQIESVEKSGLESVNSFVRKIKFYNPKINEPLHKFWYFIPNAKLTKKMKGSVSIVLSSSDTKLVESIKSLDSKVDNLLKSINSKYSPEPSIKECSDYPPVLELCVDTDSVCYDKDNNAINYTKISNGAKVLLYIEFESVIIGTKCQRNWRIMQMKETVSIDLSTNLFTQPVIPPGYSYQQLPMQPPMMHPQYMQHNPYAAYPGSLTGYYPPIDYDMNMPMAMPMAMPGPPSGRGPAPPQGRRMPAPPKSDNDICNRQENRSDKSEQKQSGQNTGSMYQPPTEDQLRSMIGNLKKATKRDDKEKNKIEPQKSDTSSSPIPPSIKSQNTNISNIANETSEIPEKCNEPEEEHKCEIVECKSKNKLTPEEEIYYVNLIKKTLSEESKKVKQWRKKFDSDVIKMNKIMAKIDNLIMNDSLVSNNDTILNSESESENESDNISTIKTVKSSDPINKEKILVQSNTQKQIIVDNNDDDSDEEDPFIIIRKK